MRGESHFSAAAFLALAGLIPAWAFLTAQQLQLQAQDWQALNKGLLSNDTVTRPPSLP